MRERLVEAHLGQQPMLQTVIPAIDDGGHAAQGLGRQNGRDGMAFLCDMALHEVRLVGRPLPGCPAPISLKTARRLAAKPKSKQWTKFAPILPAP